jgi:dTDP-4-dehydrorhamnose reductase
MKQQMFSRLSTGAVPELWGGVECTINRIGDRFRKQLDETGHARRDDDIERIAGIGFAAIRYPILWEQISPETPEEHDWGWTDGRIARLHACGQHIIAGLVHHGSGPRYTSLLDPGFATGLAAHARAVAERYPSISDWTPVNEPVTTARFSALYGHWYPHRRDEPSFWLALLNQVDATRLAMRAIRTIIPAARLIQTEDLGRTYATWALRDQAGFDNARRWMGWDLLCGLVRPGHDLWRRLCDFGLRERLAAIAGDPCPPDIIGINHYLTSDRFLDHRRHRPPEDPRSAFSDVEAIRVLDPAPQGLSGALDESWARYRLPVAITEVHNGCTREEQMRWTWRAWQIALEARARGVDVRAVTSWALFGSSGWDTLLTRSGRYEAGAFDGGGAVPRPTAMVPLLRALARGKAPAHPVLRGAGWWQRPIRFHHPLVARPAAMSERWLGEATRATEPPPVLIAGGDGRLGQALAAACRHRAIAHVRLGREALDLLDDASVAAGLDRHRPWVVLNAAGWKGIDDAEDDPAACFAINMGGAERLARACTERDIASVHVSSDLVFNGRSGGAYDEDATPDPINAYGRSKAAAEAALATLEGRHLVVRTAALFSPFDADNFAQAACGTLARGERFGASDEHVVSPTYLPDLCDAMLDLAIDGEAGLWHLTHGEPCDWADFARRLAAATGLDAGLVETRSPAELGWHAPRPRHVPLATRRGRLLPPLSDAIARFAKERARSFAAPSPRPALREVVPCL